MTEPRSEVVPPPGRLTGAGYVFGYVFPRELVEAQPLPNELRGRFCGGIGALMLVDYATSPAGPYRELVFLPGRFEVRGRRHPVITRIFVSSEASVRSGRANWALPKELATFESEARGPRRERIRVASEDRIFFEAELEWGLLPLPMLVPRWPFPFTLAQPGAGGFRLTTLHGSAIARRARLVSLRVSGHQFPDLALLRPILGVRVAPFRLVFPSPRVESGDDSGGR